MAKAQGISKDAVHRIWQSHQLKPHLSKTFKLSRDPEFLKKLTDVVGLYLNPPEKALVLCVDEKSQIQALDRTQPGLPLKKGRCRTMTHDYKRNGTTTLFAALEVAQGKVVGECYPKHRHQEFLKFLKKLDREFPGKVPLHLVLDNYATHKHPFVNAWLKRHTRFVLHFTPTSSSWLNLVERWFGELTGKRVRRGVFQSVGDLVTAINEFLATWEWQPQAVSVDGDRREHRAETQALPPDPRNHRVRLHRTSVQVTGMLLSMHCYDTTVACQASRSTRTERSTTDLLAHRPRDLHEDSFRLLSCYGF